MRRGAEAPQTQAQIREDSDARDARMEMRWVYDRRGERSTLAFVAVHQDELAREFFAWRGRNTQGDVWQALEHFEVWRFAAPLDRVSHAMLRFAVRYQLAPEDGGRRLPPAKPRPLLARIPPRDPDALARQASREHEMPRPRPPRRVTDERLKLLEEQAGTMRGAEES